MKVINYLKRSNGSGHIVEHIGWHESGDYILRQLFTNEKGYRQHKWEVEQEYDVIDDLEVVNLDRMTCGQRVNGFGPWDRTPNIDFWQTLPNGDRVCSFCGSLHPDRLIELLHEHGSFIIEPSQKLYKWYLRQPDVHNALEGGIKYYRWHDTEDLLTVLKEMKS